ncbi:related to Dcl-2 dicer RNA helicase/RNAseIII CAF [Rhynchosporium agropyri]|uniref:Related to Dcl-2 dicer RNA helicase/RNAseIII CAF n=1 Tax=Rhynchosporium agropyri TaxID=914238 RepID=A0A1E1KN45_9HELO|nr:related to Dcl-2 dicer RNA helicase/RNAseIII CAF [Rhynchosporium agropyri]
MEDLRAAFLSSPFPTPQKAGTGTSTVKDTIFTTTEVPEAEEDLANIDAALSDSDNLKGLNIQDGPPVVKPRPYQKEMLQESLKRNIIVAMDTGSGKTHIAVMRIQYEIERIPSHQIIWFLAPTVALCEQQNSYITAQVSQVQSKFLSGADNVDRWTKQEHWDAVLKNVRIVVSTYQILLDALSNGFIPMKSLALIIFDEAHNCINKHPGAKIMKSHYHPRKESGQAIPHILGLTASPVMRSNPRSVVEIETTMDAICRTPTKHRADLRLEVKLPVLLEVVYDEAMGVVKSNSIASLRKALSSLNILEDPCYLMLLKDNTEKGRAKIDKLRLNGKTWCSSQMKSFYSIAVKIDQELGAWAADFYIAQVVEKMRKVAMGVIKYGNLWDATSAEKQYLAKVLRDVKISRHSCLGCEDLHLVSDKVTKLVEVLLQETIGFQGIVFVQERATASVLAHLLSVHPSTSEVFRIGVIVGSSGHAQHSRNISELIDLGEQKDNISNFKSGKINLAIATSILEEGIDVPACNAVISFQLPANLKSFVQRRGRARHRDSKLVLMHSDCDKAVNWQQLEADMRAMYEDEMRTLQEYLILEDGEEPGHETMIFQVPSTQALLDLDNAIPHLYHFCAKLPRSAYVDARPEFICSAEFGGHIRAKVTLPLCVDQSVREAEGKLSWKSEKNAIKDAAFQAYLALYKAKLVNDNLLPSLVHDDLLLELRTSITDTRASLVQVKEQLNPWGEVAKEWNNTSVELHRATIELAGLEMTIILPVPIPRIPTIEVQWDSTTKFPIHITVESGEIRSQSDTWALLKSAFGARFSIEHKPHVVEFSAAKELELEGLMGKRDVQASDLALSDAGLIRDKFNPCAAYMLKDVLAFKPNIKLVQDPYHGYETAPDVPHISLIKVPKRTNFVQKLSAPSNLRTTKPYSTVLPTERCTMDDLPFKYYQFGRLIPVIMNRCEKYLLASMLSTTALKNIQISELALIATAISASSSGSETNYQRLEFLGDTVLKMCTSMQLMGEYPLWHEGYLSEMKGRIVSNSNLYTAAIKLGLDRFIITKQFNGHSWRPLYVDELLQQSSDDEKKREMSSKIPADVVESLIGASVLDGGIPKALTCLQTFLPRSDWTWQSLEVRRITLLERTPAVELPATLQPLETLIGHTFRNKGLLIEAMTHASCNSGSASYERFEFLGDAILDHLVVAALWTYELSHVRMHLMRTALVNADFLAFLGMEFSIEQEITDLVTDPEGGWDAPISAIHRSRRLALWQFMRHTSPHIGTVQHATSLRHATLSPHLRNSVERGTHYPWALFARLQAQKFYSDIVESLVAGVWIDSGSFDKCNEMLERLGVFKIMRRMLDEGVQVLNPKEELGMLAGTEKVKYVVKRAEASAVDTEVDGEENEDESESEGELRLLCRVFVGEREVVSIGDGVSVVEVETRAAEEAVRVLKAEKMDGVDGDGDGDGYRDGDVSEDDGHETTRDGIEDEEGGDVEMGEA